jgi:hypothetical protein
MVRTTQKLAFVSFAVLLVLAGCSGIPADDRTTADSNVSVETRSYPEGWSTDSVDPTVALGTHRQTLATLSRQSRVEITDADGYNRTVRRTVDTRSQTASVRFLDSSFGTDVESYYTADSTYEYDHTTDEVTTTRDTTWNTSDVGFQASNTIVRPLRNLDVVATESLRVAGDSAINYSVRGIADNSRTPPNAATGYIIVTERGYIAEFDITKSNDDFTRRTQYELSDVGTATVSRPSWVE